MSPEVYQAFEKVLKEAGLSRSVLEVGAVPGPLNLLEMECLRKIPERVGVNLEKPAQGEGWKIIQGDSRAMDFFKDASFEAVLCNSTLEHDPYFWKTLAEMRRVAAPGGLMVLGVPGFAGMGLRALAPRSRLLRALLRGAAWIARDESLASGSLTLGEHFFPGDYYRFTEQAMREVLLEGLVGVEVRKIMSPTRWIGWGRKP